MTHYAKAVQFFYKHAGYSYDPKKETPRQGRLRCARQLAKAEHYAFEHDWTYSWQDDSCIGADCGETATCDHPCCQGTEHVCEWCALVDADGKQLASLGSICEPSSEYRRVVRAELALEAMPRASGVAGEVIRRISL
jgi:hypothetical protein